MSDALDALERLIVDACLEDAAFAASAVAYAIDHSTNAMRRRRPEDATTEVVVFDWLARLARDLEAVPAGKVRVEGDAVWVSRRVVISLDALVRRVAPERAGDVANIREWASRGGERDPSPTLASALREMNFSGGLLERLVVDPDLDFGPTFGTRRGLVSRLLLHARTTGAPLKLSELMHESAFSGGLSMRPPKDDAIRVSPPWERTWTTLPSDVDIVEKTFSVVLGTDSLTHRGQRKIALRLLRGSRSEGDRGWMGAAWILSAGGNVAARRRLAARLDVTRRHETTSWASRVIPWVDARVLVDSSSDATDAIEAIEATRDAVRSFFVVAKILDAAPQGHECAFRAWEGTEVHLNTVERDRPHLAHVVERASRHRRHRLVPPESLVSRVVDAMRERVDAHVGDREVFAIEPTFIVSPTTPDGLEDVVRALERDGCHADAERILTFAKKNAEREIGVFVFHDDDDDDYETRPRITRVDVEHAAWRHPGSVVAALGTTRFFLAGARGSSKDPWPTVEAHPLSSLVASSTDHRPFEHPLSSSCAELLTRGARLGLNIKK
ncbi:MAG: hypothetical protein CMI16_06685 [Opitutaceae bacterium]|nr:hypothetical protein [Opitutaceae bacterium]